MSAFERFTAALREHGSRMTSPGMWRCPAHADGTASLSVSNGDGAVLLHCHAGCVPEDVVAALGLRMSDLFDEPRTRGSGSVVVAEYVYEDADGAPVLKVIRRSDKQFPQMRMEHGRWVSGGVKDAPVYRLPRVIEAARTGGTVYVCEGEKDVHALEAAGVVSTCNPMGAGCWRDRHADALVGAGRVVVVADRDRAGYEHAEAVRASLAARGVPVEVVEAVEGKDPHDVLVVHGLVLGEAFRPVDATAPKATEGGRATAEGALVALSAVARPVPAWPAPILGEAFQGLAGTFVDTVLPHTEADPAALLVSFLAAVGSAVGANPHVLIGADRHPAKIYPVLVGSTSSGRKGSSLGWAERQVEMADPAWADRHVANVGSGEVLVWAVRDGDHPDTTKKDPDAGVGDKRLWIAETEFGGLLRVAGRDGSILSAMLRQCWDRDTLKHTTKAATIRATGAHVVIVGHITPEELRRELSRTEAANGFGNRFLWVAVRRSKALPRGGVMPVDEMRPVARSLEAVLTHARGLGHVTHDESFWSVFEPRYADLTGDRPGLVGAMLGRGAPYVHRLALIYALLDGDTVIRGVHAEAALAVWDYCAASAEHLFGASTGDRIADELIIELRGRPGGMTRTEARDLFSRHRDVGPALEHLERLGLARCEREVTAGRPRERWHATDTAATARKATKGGAE